MELQESRYASIGRCPLFRDIPAEQIKAWTAQDGFLLQSYDAGCAVCHAHDKQARTLGVILSGRATVFRVRCGGRVPLHRLQAPDAFGAATLFGGDGAFVTDIEAETPVTAALFSQTLVRGMIRDSSTFAESYICFLSERVRFLNARISSFTAGSTAARVAGYLATLPAGAGKTLTRSRLAAELDIGRASLYRALDTLSAAGAIAVEGREIRVLDTEICRSIR